MASLRIVDDPERLARLVPSWRSLLGRSASPALTQTPLWLLAWWRQFGAEGGRRLRVVLFEEDGRLVGLLPVTRRLVFYRSALPVRRLELLGTGESEADNLLGLRRCRRRARKRGGARARVRLRGARW